MQARVVRFVRVRLEADARRVAACAQQAAADSGSELDFGSDEEHAAGHVGGPAGVRHAIVAASSS